MNRTSPVTLHWNWRQTVSVDDQADVLHEAIQQKQKNKKKTMKMGRRKTNDVWRAQTIWSCRLQLVVCLHDAYHIWQHNLIWIITIFPAMTAQNNEQ